MADDKPDEIVDDTEVEETEDGDGDEGSENDDSTPSPEEVARMRRALKRQAAENKRTRAKLTELQKAKSDTKPDDIKAEAKREAEAAYKPMIIKTAARAAFAEAGIRPERLDRAVKNLELDGLELASDGTVEGLDDQIQDLKDDTPEWFTAPRRRGAAGVDAASATPVRKKKSIGQMHAEKLGLPL